MGNAGVHNKWSQQSVSQIFCHCHTWMCEKSSVACQDMELPWHTFQSKWYIILAEITEVGQWFSALSAHYNHPRSCLIMSSINWVSSHNNWVRVFGAESQAWLFSKAPKIIHATRQPGLRNPNYIKRNQPKAYSRSKWIQLITVMRISKACSFVNVSCTHWRHSQEGKSIWKAKLLTRLSLAFATSKSYRQDRNKGQGCRTKERQAPPLSWRLL